MRIFNYEIEREKLILCGEVLLLFLCFFMPITVTSSSGNNPDNPGSFSVSMINYILAAGPQIFLIIYLIWLKQDVKLPNFGVHFPVPKDFLYGLGHALVLFILLLFVSSLVRFFPETVQRFMEPATEVQFGSRSNPLLVLIFSLTTGYREELFFRAYLLTRFKQLGLDLKKAVALSAVLFGCMHFYQGLFGVLFTGLVGVYLALVFLKTRSLNMIAFAHAVFNTMMLLLST